MATDFDVMNWTARGRVDKFYGPDADRRARLNALLTPDVEIRVGSWLAPDESMDAGSNLLTTAGLNRITSLITGAGGQAATNTATRIGVGDSATAATIADVDLNGVAGATHRQFEVMSATFPTQANGVMTFKAVFATGEANFQWNEWGVDIGTPTVTAGTTVNANFVNHKVINLGTKTSNAAWTFTVTITLT